MPLESLADWKRRAAIHRRSRKRPLLPADLQSLRFLRGHERGCRADCSAHPLACLGNYGITLPVLSCPSDKSPDTNYGSYIWSPILQGEQPEDVHIYTPGGVFTIQKLSRLTVCTDNGRPHRENSTSFALTATSTRNRRAFPGRAPAEGMVSSFRAPSFRFSYPPWPRPF